MKLLVVAVGRMKGGAERELLGRYLDRAMALSRGLGIGAVQSIELDESRARTTEGRRRDEAALIRDKIPAGATVILLDESGQAITSESFAALVARERDAGSPALAFVIGGPDGHDAAWRGGQRTLAFGAATFPHQLVRVMLAEQIYRAFTILAGHPYHRT